MQKKPSAITRLIKQEADVIKEIKEGDFIEAALIERGKRVAYFDLGKFGTGRVYGIEFSNASDLIKNLKEGESIKAKILEDEDQDGFVDLSLAEAGKQQLWEEVNEVKDRDEAITVTIEGANAGGLMTDIAGVKAFLPASQLSNENYPRVEDGDKQKILEELKKLVGQKLKVKIIASNPAANKLIVSEKEVTGESVKKLLDAYNVGDVIDGIISGVADFGAFIRFADQPAVEGLIHISEIDHRLIDDPKEVLKVNDSVKAKIVEIKDGKVSLSLKALKDNPWDKVKDKYKEGQSISGAISRFNPFGAFVAIDEDIQGLIHVSEFGSVEIMKDVLELEQKYEFRIDLINPEEKRIILKLTDEFKAKHPEIKDNSQPAEEEKVAKAEEADSGQ
ncbi:MAG: 30S ribosomal protein S1 [Candidatus Harrisonbacteria bacterium CG10_big_fil_rev_8_21_14_0_10_44_23]|uniref:30S ribosomal protein S1 n=1 Tax=Candidatus Harrisonbacteria bacterium CG10_big_fil_rev_8_21_14_0_10_44_23 TaxID=1974585 RepID=A0A2H0UQX1_9BACT|nr:MAG: 30S ribosomal protein S1 [Candidatus Harrisonbacteria bacterium CG10_big_fil_rev_8_21_14_0_10_44_23]